jgi:hypothetical protein
VFKVIDSIKPILTLTGKSPVIVEVKTAYIDAGVQVTDNYYSTGLLTPIIKSFDSVNTAKIGKYTFTYTVTDPSGNKAKVVRIVIVADTIKPVLKLNGANTDSVEVFHTYKDPGYTVTDNYDKASNIVVTISGSFYKKFPAGKIPDKIGRDTIVYNAKDSSGNITQVIRVVKVQDRTAPVLTLIGPFQVTVCRWFNYVDAGYTLSDNYDSVKDLKIDTIGTFFKNRTTIQDYLDIRYRAVDKSGNVGISGPRVIQVLPAGSAGCSTGLNQGGEVNGYVQVYPNPGSGIFHLNISMPTTEKVRISISNIMGQEIAKIHNGLLGNNYFSVDLSSQAAGVYLLKVSTDNQVVTKRIEVVK